MATVFKTPGVYIEEIPKLPPSVAQVETAIPAFVGYTEKAEEISFNDLLLKPKRISSMVEFELYFGGAPSPEVSEISIDGNNNFISAKTANKFFTYDSLQMFYANGGGDCYIVSIGPSKSSTAIAEDDFTKGIKKLEMEDAPTIILFPDAVALNDSQISNIQKATLSQCGALQDRVALFDVRKDDPLGIKFRDNIGINNLKYGMAYTPWLKVSLPKNIRYTNIKNAIKRLGIGVPLQTLTTDAAILAMINNVDQAYNDASLVANKTEALAPGGSLSDAYAQLLSTFNGPSGNTDGNLKALFDYVLSVGKQANDYLHAASPNAVTYQKFKDEIKAAITSGFDPLFEKIIALNKNADVEIASYTASDFSSMITVADWPKADGAVAASDIAGANDEEKRLSAVNLLAPMFDKLNILYRNEMVKTSRNHAQTLDNSLALSFPTYKNILTGVANSMTVIPPSGAIAGVYATVDRTKGVWKAPANISLNNVISPDTSFTAAQLENLNVDAVAGKSINAIRAFTGKGTLVWGARTLMGNDNEWRYISVRRFFNMVEESCKKSTEPFVFEPNDANTWVKVQGMIENFLTVLWRQGALQGAKPEHAFYVAVGLGKTMTALDILEGRMIIEVGMAVVRPAEFIILQFSHKMAES